MDEIFQSFIYHTPQLFYQLHYKEDIFVTEFVIVGKIQLWRKSEGTKMALLIEGFLKQIWCLKTW